MPMNTTYVHDIPFTSLHTRPAPLPDVMPLIKHIACPNLAICGLADVMTPPKYSEFFKANIPNCTLELIPDAGHWAHVEQADQVNAAIATFLHTLR